MSTELVPRDDRTLAPYRYDERAMALAVQTKEQITEIVRGRVKAQAASSAAGKLKLIQHDAKLAPKKRVLDEVDKMVEMTGYLLPYDLIYLIQTRNGSVAATPTAAGYFTMVQCHPEILMAVQDTFQVDPIGDKTIITAKARLVFASGKVIEGTRVKCLEDERSKNPNLTLQDVINKALTQARGKAAETGCPFPIKVGVAEETLDWERSNGAMQQEERTRFIEGGTKRPPKQAVSTPPAERAITSLGQLLAEIYKLKGIATAKGYDVASRESLCGLCNVKSLEEIKDFTVKYKEVKERLEKAPVAVNKETGEILEGEIVPAS